MSEQLATSARQSAQPVEVSAAGKSNVEFSQRNSASARSMRSDPVSVDTISAMIY